ncbi:WbqC family protein [Cellvibrio sp. pealriver]|uniref:WbqC family protein n=1 Tax=Cellvibrio sp. pealriver TaxID=1622269 RepID=UPI00066FF4FA
MRIVISQSMFFPWVGMLEQIKLADIFVHYDDVAFSKGSFTNRVQLKTPSGSRWLTLPLKDLHLGMKIQDVSVQAPELWFGKHKYLLQESLGSSPYANDALALYDSVLSSHQHGSLSEIARASMLALVNYFNLHERVTFLDSRDLAIGGEGSDRVLAIVKELGGTEYITGHGARHYLNHQKFFDAGVEVEYMNYHCMAYPQQHGAFTPYVSALDLIANCGHMGIDVMQSTTRNWRSFLEKHDE